MLYKKIRVCGIKYGKCIFSYVWKGRLNIWQMVVLDV